MEDNKQEKIHQIDLKIARLDEEYELKNKKYHADLEKMTQLNWQFQKNFQKIRNRAVSAMAEVNDKQDYVKQSNMIEMRSNEVLKQVYRRRCQELDESIKGKIIANVMSC